MCGINGWLRLDPDGAPVDRTALETTRDRMHSRGPDACGSWIDVGNDIGFGHRRLSIIDLTEGGAQPMAADDGSCHLVYNGELYNYRELRDELTRDGERFRSDSDTEVVLRLLMRHGKAALPRLRGMFALAFWDARRRSLLLVRDPYGIKPLFYAHRGDALQFASQVKALLDGSETVDPGGLGGFLMWGSLPEPWTLYREVRSVPAGHSMEVLDGVVHAPEGYRPLYLDDVEPGTFAAQGANADLTAAFEDCVRGHLIADVPVGIFLSAGLDSALLAALAMRVGDGDVSTFTLRFDAYRDSERDEGPLAAEVAKTLGTRHIERTVRREEFLDLWPQALRAMDQPSIDGFNTFVVSKAAREAGFKVALSGLGGDELMGSYSSFVDVPRWNAWARRLRRVPGLPAIWPALAARFRPQQPKLSRFLTYGRDLPGCYFLRHGLFLPHELPSLIGLDRTAEALAAYNPWVDAAESMLDRDAPWVAVHRMESAQFMRNQLLRDADWASMAHSLEVRVPLVDACLRDRMERAQFEPARSQGKAALVRQLAPELPEALWNRPKSGFSIPVTEWLEEQSGVDPSMGLASRRLALKVLREFGVELEPAAERNARLT